MEDHLIAIADRDGNVFPLRLERFELARIEPGKLTVICRSPNGPKETVWTGDFDPKAVAAALPACVRLPELGGATEMINRDQVTHIAHDNRGTLMLGTVFGICDRIVAANKADLQRIVKELGPGFFAATTSGARGHLHLSSHRCGVTARSCIKAVYIDKGYDYPDYIEDVAETHPLLQRRYNKAKKARTAGPPPQPEF